MLFSKKKQEIPIFFASDNNYAPYLAVTLESLLSNASADYIYKIYVLTSFISDEHKQKISKILSNHSEINTILEFVSLADKIEGIKHKFHLRDYYSLETYYRFFIPDMFPEFDKVIYLDCDIVLLGDISDMYCTNISNYLVGAVHDQVFSQYADPFSEYAEQVLGIKTKNVFNAGVLLMNTKMFRAYSIQQKFFNLMEKYKFRVTQDEDYLNVLCAGKVRYLNLGWNKMAFDYPGFDNVDLQLIHYNLAYKPWHYEDVMYAEYFWQYASKTDYYDFILDQLKAYNNEKQLRDIESFEMLKQIALEDITNPDNYKKTIEKEQRKHYIKRGLNSIAKLPGIKGISRYLTSQGYKILYEYNKYRKRQNKTVGS